MNKYLRLFGILSLLCFSFYYTEKIAKFMQRKDPIYESILAVEEDYKMDSVNAVIDNDTIIPGIYGQTINLEKSFQNMKQYGFFREDALVFDTVSPEITLEENKDKIIEKGNPLKQGVTFILEDENMISYFEEIGLPYSVLTTKENVNTKRTNGMKINATTTDYEKVEKDLKLKKENNNFCFLTVSSLSFCKEKKKLLIKESMTLNKSNFLKTYNKVTSGYIIYLEKDIGMNNLKLFIENILFHGLDILSLEDLLKENRY